MRGSIALDDQGYVKTDRQQKTSLDGVYAAGDVCIKPLRQVVTAVGDGALAATELERYAAAMQKKTGKKPELPAQAVNNGGRGSADASRNAGAMEESGSTAGGTQASTYTSQKAVGSPGEANGLFSPDILQQLHAVFGRMERPLVLKLFLDPPGFRRAAGLHGRNGVPDRKNFR